MTEKSLMRLGVNKTLVRSFINEKDVEVFFSYDTPVAVKTVGCKYLRTEKKYSPTTTRHLNWWLGKVEAELVPQEVIDVFADGLPKDITSSKYKDYI